jgi:hypothetical protein
MDEDVPATAPRLVVNDLRLQWSCAYQERAVEPATLVRLRQRVRDTIVEVERGLARATSDDDRRALDTELGSLRSLAAQMDRLSPIAGAGAPAGRAPG